MPRRTPGAALRPIIAASAGSVLALGGGGGDGLAAPFTRVNGAADDPFTAAIAGSFHGWSLESPSAITDGTEFDVDQAGYDGNAQPRTWRTRHKVTKKVRIPAPNPSSATLSTSTYASSNYILSGDTLFGGATNNSTLLSPKPVARIVSLSRSIIGNTVGIGTPDLIEVIAGHWFARGGREVAAVKFIWNDGVNAPVEVVRSNLNISGNPRDAIPVEVFALPSTSLASLNDGVVKLDIEVYPWIGGAASVQKTVDWSNAYEFTTQYFRKSATLANSRPVCWVGVGGTAGGTVASGGANTAANAASAQANKFGTIKQAADAAKAALTTGTKVDGLIIYVDDGIWDLESWSANFPQICGVVTIRRSPTSTSKSAVILRSGAAVWNPNFAGSFAAGITRGCLRIEDVRHIRNGAQAIVSAHDLQIVNCEHDNNAQTSSILVSSSAHLYIDGVTPLTTNQNQRMSPQTTPRIVMVRGWNGDAVGTWERTCLVGNIFVAPSSLDNISTIPVRNVLAARNRFFNITSATFYGWQGGDVIGAASLSNVYEFTGTSAGHSMCIANDSANYNATHAFSHNDTFAGAGNGLGRINWAYDDGPTARLCLFCGLRAPILVSVYHKGDRFMYETNQLTIGIAQGPQRLGNWAFLYGVGCEDWWVMYRGNGQVNTSNETQAYPGLGTVVGTQGAAGVTMNNTELYIRHDPLFVDRKCSQSQFEASGGSHTVPVAGAGQGDYRLQAGSGAKNKVQNNMRAFTQDGVPVGANDNMGALSAVA